MIIDSCAFIGRHPFSRMRDHSASDLLRLMDKSGIDGALTAPLAGAFYQNCQEANEELAVEIGPHSDRLSLIAAVNPAYPGWRQDIERSRESLSAVGIRLFPGYHAYDLSSAAVSSLAETAGELGLPVFVSVRLWDERQHPPTCMVPAVPAAEVAELAGKHPGTDFVLSMGRFGEITAALKAGPRNLFADIAGVQGPVNCMRRLADEVGAERLLFGTELLLQYGLPARYKVDYGRLSDSERKAICEGNVGSNVLGQRAGRLQADC